MRVCRVSLRRKMEGGMTGTVYWLASPGARQKGAIVTSGGGTVKRASPAEYSKFESKVSVAGSTTPTSEGRLKEVRVRHVLSWRVLFSFGLHSDSALNRSNFLLGSRLELSNSSSPHSLPPCSLSRRPAAPLPPLLPCWNSDHAPPTREPGRGSTSRDRDAPS